MTNVREGSVRTEKTWKGATVLVTGASGFIGRPLTRALVLRGAQVHGSTRRAAPPDGTIEWHTANLEEPGDVQRLFDRVHPDFVFHLSSLAVVGSDMALVMPTFRAEVVASVNVLLNATRSGCKRIVLPASLEEPRADLPPNSAYAAAKAATTVYAAMFHAVYGAPVRLARIYMTYGPGQPKTKVIPQIIRSLRAGRSPVLVSPHRLVDWIFIDDVVDGLLAIAESDASGCCGFELGSGRLTSIGEVASRLSVIISGHALPVAEGRPPDRQEVERCAEIGATTESTGWRPQVALDDGLRRTVAAYEAG